MKETILRQRIIQGNELKGYFVAKVIDGIVYFGYSMCDDEDRLDKKLAYEIALARANKKHIMNYIPSSTKNDFILFYDRAFRCFKEFGLVNETCFDGVHYYGVELRELAKELKEKNIAKKKAEFEADKENCDNVSYWVSKYQKRNSKYNRIGLFQALMSDKSKLKMKEK